jgi:hypothetical protein
MFVCAGFYGLLVRWLMTTADHGRSQRDDESCSQASTYLRAGRLSVVRNIKRALSVRPSVRESAVLLTAGVERVPIGSRASIPLDAIRRSRNIRSGS